MGSFAPIRRLDIVARSARMRVDKRGDSLAIRLPAAVVETLRLKEGDEVEVQIAGPRVIEIARSITPEQREAALARISEARWKLPPYWKFDRSDANSR
jgi:antitoxin MazE